MHVKQPKLYKTLYSHADGSMSLPIILFSLNQQGFKIHSPGAGFAYSRIFIFFEMKNEKIQLFSGWSKNLQKNHVSISTMVIKSMFDLTSF